jgi:hypothetical protein
VNIDFETTTKPLEGKTYSLHGSVFNSDEYYRRIHTLADDLLRQGYDLRQLLQIVQDTSRSRRRLKKLVSQSAHPSVKSSLAHTLRDQFSRYTTTTSSHLESLPLARRWDRTLATSEEQYHFAMLEVELVNRIHVAEFRRCDTRLAFLPHCLHDLMADCRSAPRGDDYTCKGCSRSCVINAISKLLRRHGVVPYIWMTANLQSLLKRLHKEGKKVGVVGIACLPELLNGMRMCARADVPVTGIPLDANRCARWWGSFYWNTVNIRELEILLGDETTLHPPTNSLLAAGLTAASSPGA